MLQQQSVTFNLQLAEAISGVIVSLRYSYRVLRVCHLILPGCEYSLSTQQQHSFLSHKYLLWYNITPTRMSTKRQKMERSSRDNHQDHQEDDERKPAARAFVWVKVPTYDQHKAKLSVEVKACDSIDTIKEAIKKKRSNAFASIDASDLELFESEQDIEQEKPPLDPTMEWNPNVTWGTKTQPLIVQVPVKRIYESPWSYSNGEC
jgi:hypothetical protein